MLRRGFSSDRSGTAAVELALIVVPMLVVLFSVIETGIVLILNLTVEQTVQRVARVIKTGGVQASDIQTAADFRSKLLCPAGSKGLLPPYLDCNRVILDVRTTASLSDADLTADFYTNGKQRFCMGGSQAIVVVRIAYTFPAIMPNLSFVPGAAMQIGLVDDVPNYAGWNHLMLNAAIFQNEYAGGGSQAPC